MMLGKCMNSNSSVLCKDFSSSAEIFSRKLREDPGPLYGITQSTATVVEGLATVLGELSSNTRTF